MKKNIIAILTATIIFLSSLAPLLSIYTVQAVDPTSYYKTVLGNLGTDTYALYPFAAKSLDIGFSQFGELIDGTTKTGLFYDTTDPFAPDTASPPEWQWVEGWILNVTYVQGGDYQNVWALATYSDYQDSNGVGGNWHEGVTVGSLSLTVRGGRKTSGGAVTDPITVLYDGPRRYVGMTKTTIYNNAAHDIGLLSLTFYFDFDKVSKQVVIMKDVKRIDIGKNIGAMQVEFGDRGEWDLGAGGPPKSYAHFYQNQTTVYGGDWQPWYFNASLPVTDYTGTYDVCQIIDDEMNYAGWAAFWPKPITSWVGATQEEANRPTIMTTITTITEDQLGTGSKLDFHIALGNPTAYPKNSSTGVHWTEDPMVFVMGAENEHRNVVSAISDPATQVTYNRETNNVTFPNGYAPALDQIVRLVYKVNRSKTDMSTEPNSPFVIGEWAFEMYEAPSQFRGVTVYGIGDVHNADDLQHSQAGNILDRELMYQLNVTFNPWDLYQAIWKKTSRWVQYYNATTYDYVALTHRPVIDVSDSEWDQYDVFSERVEDLTAGELLHRVDDDPVAGEDHDYEFDIANGYATVDDLTVGHYYKILYSTYNEISEDEFTLYDTVVNQTLGTGIDWDNDIYDGWTDYLNVEHDVNVEDFTFDIINMTAIALPNQNLTWTYTGPTLEWQVEPFKVFKEDHTTLEIGSDSFENVSVNDTQNNNYTLQFHIQAFEITWDIDPPSGLNFTDYQDVHFYGWDNDVESTITVAYSNVTLNFTVTAAIDFVNDARGEPLYTEFVPGRYEWGTVGRDAASVDSAGLSLVSAAFKNKQVEYGLAGEDMYAIDIYSQMPWVMNKIGSATETLHTFSNYYYNNWEGYANDYRVALKDDWCTTWPISSSNMISVGGPLANMLSYYENDFSHAFYGLSQFTSDPIWANHIVASTCWMPHDATHAYTSSNATGYGIITSYLDENGTAVLQIWGVWGRDTYYLTKWFHEYGIMQLQDAPDGLTSIVVKISYTSYPEGYKPTAYHIVECLGTVSERLWIHNSENKGGIHDP
jgi:hypothetical protein